MVEVVGVDLPGAYSMSPFTSETSITSSYVRNEHPDAIINIVDAFSGLPSPSKRPTKSKKGESDSADTQFTEEELQRELERVRGMSMQIMIAVIDLYRKIPYSLLDILLSN